MPCLMLLCRVYRRGNNLVDSQRVMPWSQGYGAIMNQKGNIVPYTLAGVVIGAVGILVVLALCFKGHIHY